MANNVINATATFDGTNSGASFMIGSAPIHFQNDVMIGSIPISISFVPMIRTSEGAFEIAPVAERKDGRIFEIENSEETQEDMAITTFSPGESSSQNTARLRVPSGMKAPRKIKKAYQNELVVRPSLPVSNSFAPLRLVKKNSPVACLKTLEEYPPEYQIKYLQESPKAKTSKPAYKINKNQEGKRKARIVQSSKDRNDTPRTPVHERIVFPKVPVHERLSFPGKNSGRPKAPVKERLGTKKKTSLGKREWRPKATGNNLVVQTEVKAKNLQYKKRRIVWREKNTKTFSRVCMLEVEEELAGFAHVYAISEEEGEAAAAGRRGKARKVKTDDKASSSNNNAENPFAEDKENEGRNDEEEGPGGVAEIDEVSRLRKELERKERKMLRIQQEKEEEMEAWKRMCRFLRRKGLLDEYLGEGSDTSPKKKGPTKELSDEEEEEKERKQK